jgi:hypothetical protein
MCAHKPTDWPPDVDPIALEDLGRLGINPQQDCSGMVGVSKYGDGLFLQAFRNLSLSS